MRRIALALTLAVALVGTVAPLGIARAAVITVTTIADDINANGDCSLREAILAANEDRMVDACPAGNGADSIELGVGTYTLTRSGANEDLNVTGDLDVTQPLSLIGEGIAATVLDGGGLDRVIDVRGAGSVTIVGLTVRNGSAGAQPGGGIRAFSSTLLLNDVRVTASATDDVGGGVFVTSGSLTMVGSRVDGNASTGGGGLMLAYSVSQIITSVIDANQATNPFDDFSGPGGGIANAGGPLTLRDVTLSGNRADREGGGVYSAFTLGLYNVTVAANTADDDADGTGEGGGVYFTDAFVPGEVFTARNSLIADNSDLSPISQHPDCSGPLTGGGYNLIGDATGCTLGGVLTGNVLGSDPALGPLYGNGGDTLTHALLAGSPAIDAGNPAGCKEQNGFTLSSDQRGFPRPVDGDGNGSQVCDIGAFEAAPGFIPPTATPTPSRTATTTATVTATMVPPTATRTSTAVPPTATRTHTPLPPTATRTATNPPPITLTPSATATASRTATATRTPSATPTRNCTPSADNPPCTATPTGTLSATPTATATATATRTPSATPTATRTIVVVTLPATATSVPVNCSGGCLYLPSILRAPAD